jgi:hypothetical protein
MSSPLGGSCGGDLEAAGDFFRGSAIGVSVDFTLGGTASARVKGSGTFRLKLNLLDLLVDAAVARLSTE